MYAGPCKRSRGLLIRGFGVDPPGPTGPTSTIAAAVKLIQSLVTRDVTQDGRSMGGVTPRKQAQRRRRGSIDPLPSGALRVRVYAGMDPLTGRGTTWSRSSRPARRRRAQAEAARTRLLSQVDERRNPRTQRDGRPAARPLPRAARRRRRRTRPRTSATPTSTSGRCIGRLRSARSTPRSSTRSTPSCAAAGTHCDRAGASVDHRTTGEHECDDALPAAPVPAAGRRDGPADPLHPQRRPEAGRALAVDRARTRSTQAEPPAGAEAGPAAADRRSRPRASSTRRGRDPGLGHAGLAGHDDRRPARRAVRAALAHVDLPRAC